MKIRLLSEKDIRTVVPTAAEIVGLVEQAYRLDAARKAEVPTKIGVHPDRPNTFLHAMPAWVGGETRALGMKWVSYFPGNFSQGIPDSHGIIVLKFWLHLSPEEQLRRFRHREETAYKRHKINAEDWRNRRRWSAYEVAVGDMLELTDRPNAPWHLIPADNKRYARLEILKTSCRQIASAL